MTVLRLNKLSLENFRCFAQCEVEFHPDLTVLVAENGSGKTAVLDAVAIAMSQLVNAISKDEELLRISNDDVRLKLDPRANMVAQFPSSYRMHGTVNDTSVEWGGTVYVKRRETWPNYRTSKALKMEARHFLSDDAVLPLIGYYRTSRAFRNTAARQDYRRTSIRNITERVTAYADCFSSRSSTRAILSWFEQRYWEIAHPAFKESLSVNLALIAGVQAAANRVLEPAGWSDFEWNADLQTVTVRHRTQGRLPYFMLSDGVRTMLALVVDIARRCASLNPQLSDQAPVQTPGVLIVDEVDMHLHPRWQQQVLGLLQSAFPALQIIVSTHSPHVLSTVDKSSIRVFHIDGEDMRIETPSFQTKGVESADVLAVVMDVDPVPQLQETDDLRTYRALIEDGKDGTPEATALRARLDAHYGPASQVMVDCDRLIRFQQFRLRHEKPDRT